jgi:hypothetical protein
MVGDDDRITDMMRNELDAVRYTLRELQEVVAAKESANIPVLPITYTSIEALVRQVESLEDALAEREQARHGGILSRLAEPELRTVDRIFAWLLILFGYVIAMTMSLNKAGWTDPVFRIVRKVPGTPVSWAAALTLAVTVYAAGELINTVKRRRGCLIITGSILCASWCLAMCLSMARMVYEEPTRITTLWPMVMLFMALLYGSRAVIYANAFTGYRWTTNPYQLWGMLLLMMVSLSQIVIGISPESLLKNIPEPVVLQFALVNFMSAAVVMFGLHLRNKETAINLELSGTVTLFATLGWYFVSELQHHELAGTMIPFGLTQALFITVFKSVH